MINKHLVKTEFHRTNLIKTFENIEIPDCGLMVEWCNADSKRTIDQNNLMWVHAYPPIAVKLSEFNNQIITKEMVHEVCKDKFLPPILVPRKDGTVKRYPGSTTRLGKKAFGDYLEQVYAWGAELGAWFE